MRVLIRADSGKDIGFGHISRCLTLAKALKKNGVEVCFVSKKHQGNSIGAILKENIKVYALSVFEKESIKKCDQPKWLGSSITNDASQTIEFVKKYKPDLIIIDHYGIDIIWHSILKPFVKNIMVIDDLANRPHGCDILLDQNWYSNSDKRYEELAPKNCTFLLGPRFALIKPEFSNYYNICTNINTEVQRIFIFFGGSDNYNLSLMALKVLAKKIFENIQIDIVLGESNPNIKEINALASRRKKTKIYVQTSEIDKIMSKCDLAIASGGVNTWERLCLGLNSLVITVAENQIESMKNLEREGVIKLIGHATEINEEMFFEKIYEYIKIDNHNYKKKKNKVIDCDGKGANRVASMLLNYLNRKDRN